MENIYTDDCHVDINAMATALEESGDVTLKWQKSVHGDYSFTQCDHPSADNRYYRVIAYYENGDYFFYPRLLERVYKTPELEYALGYSLFSDAIKWCEQDAAGMKE